MKYWSYSKEVVLLQSWTLKEYVLLKPTWNAMAVRRHCTTQTEETGESFGDTPEVTDDNTPD